MATRSLNKVQLIGNLTRDPELRYTPQGTAVCTFGLATNRSWVTEGGDKKEETEFHRAVAWNKLAEICSQFLNKGRRIYLEGRLQTRQWTAQDGSPRQTTEVVISEMIMLDGRRVDAISGEGPVGEISIDGKTATVAEVAPAKEEKGEAAQSVGVPTASGNKSKKQTGGRAAKKKADDEETTEEAEEQIDDKKTEKDEIDKDEIPF